ncbi:MgtC/SapB family protein [Kribbella sp. NPDC050820]|uniref:MgtC/SapB family protein n=1 Tax=Kribbella sp. NPDC050820 TaxID=3155408 RepID=UPI0033F0EC43
MSTLQVVLAVGVAALLGAVVGLEREVSGQHAGMRTHALVAMGAALFTLVGAYGFPDMYRSINVDPMRVGAQIVSGIGFVGAGAILRDAGSVRGVTTAAALWTSAALGMACGAHLYIPAVIGTVMILTALTGLRLVKQHGVASFVGREHVVEAIYSRGHGTLGPILQAMENVGVSVRAIQIDDEPHDRHVTMTIKTRDIDPVREEIDALTERPEIRHLAVRTA